MINSLLVGLAIAAVPQATEAQKLEAIWAAAEERILMQEDAWFDDGEFPMVVQLLRFHAELEPKSYEIATNLGWMHENIEQWDEASTAYRQYAVNNPSDPDRVLPEAEYLFRRKKFPEIVPLVEPTINDKSHPNLFRILAHSYERTGKLAQSKAMWNRYIALSPNDGAAKANLKRVEGKLSAQK